MRADMRADVVEIDEYAIYIQQREFVFNSRLDGNYFSDARRRMVTDPLQRRCARPAGHIYVRRDLA